MSHSNEAQVRTATRLVLKYPPDSDSYFMALTNFEKVVSPAAVQGILDELLEVRKERDNNDLVGTAAVDVTDTLRNKSDRLEKLVEGAIVEMNHRMKNNADSVRHLEWFRDLMRDQLELVQGKRT